jgi:hypothetical protein
MLVSFASQLPNLEDHVSMSPSERVNQLYLPPPGSLFDAFYYSQS